MEDAFLYSIITIGAGVLGMLIRYLFKSKCVEFECCYGMVRIKRDVEIEAVDTKNDDEESSDK